MATVISGTSISIEGITLTSDNIGGTVKQVVQTQLTSTYSATSNTAEVIVTGIASTITPTSASNKVLVMFNCMFGNHVTTYGGYFKREIGATKTRIGRGDYGVFRQQVGMGLGYNGDANQANQASYTFLDTPSTTSATTYQLYLRNDNNVACFFNRSPNDQNNNIGKRGISTITLWEIAP